MLAGTRRTILFDDRQDRQGAELLLHCWMVCRLIRAKDKNVRTQPRDDRPALSLITEHDAVNALQRRKQHAPFLHGVIWCMAFFLLHPMVRRQDDHELVAESFCIGKEPNMARMDQIKHAKDDHALSFFPSVLDSSRH